MSVRAMQDDLDLLLGLLPAALRTALAAQDNRRILEIVLDLGRPPEARYEHAALRWTERLVTRGDLDAVVAAVGNFGADNRAGIEGTLHRISAIRNRRGDIIGLTLRVGRTVSGTIDLIRDQVETGRSLLLLGRPGVGKTTKLREVARVLADELGKRVVIVDTSNEIAGDGDVPHPAVGSARRLMVAVPERQHAVMIEAVENHMPEVIIVDEIGTASEALAARTIAERGVQLIGTAHGNTLENLVQNPTLSDLVGGVQTVILGDDEARFRGSQKTVNERKGPPAFDAVVEIVSRDEIILHADCARAVDAILRGVAPRGLRRRLPGELTPGAGGPTVQPPSPPEPLSPVHAARGEHPIRLYAHALSRDSVERVLRDLALDAKLVRLPDQAELILSLKARAEDPKLRHLSELNGIPVHSVRKNTTAQIRSLLASLFHVAHGEDRGEVEAMVRETELAVQRVLAEGVAVELSPRPAALRRLQHRVVARHGLVAESRGREADRRLVIHPL